MLKRNICALTLKGRIIPWVYIKPNLLTGGSLPSLSNHLLNEDNLMMFNVYFFIQLNLLFEGIIYLKTMME